MQLVIQDSSKYIENLKGHSHLRSAQVVWYLNAFWGYGMKDKAESLWEFVEKASQIDKSKQAGSGLDELEAHR